MKKMFQCAAVLSLLSTLIYQPSTIHAQGTAFTYQGRLNDASGPASGVYDFKFALHSAAAGATQVGSTAGINGVDVSNGLFTVTLDFGNQFPGADRWLEIAVQTNGFNTFTTLAPRQQLTPTPYAITAGNLSGILPLAQLPSAVVTNGAGGVVLNGTFTGNGSGVTNVNAEKLGGYFAGNYWQLGGNNVSAGQFLGSTNNQPVEIKVNGARALRLEPTFFLAPNVIGGAAVNYISPGPFGSVIAGGGAENYFGIAYTNGIVSSLAFIGGGGNNLVYGADFSALVGGQDNSIQGYNHHSFLGGGQGNAIGMNSWDSVLGGGENNSIQNSYDSVLGGGVHNTIQGFAHHAVIGGGSYNSATNLNATVGGGNNNVAGGAGSTVGGGSYNYANGLLATVAGGGASFYGNFANGNYSTIGGGSDNFAYGNTTVIAGGYENVTGSNAYAAVIGGGIYNRATNEYATVSGGSYNRAGGSDSTVGGGDHNVAGGTNSTVGGGSYNVANGIGATVAGGARYNFGNFANGDYSTIGGGSDNFADGTTTVIAGGYANHTGSNSYVAVIGGGYANAATNAYATVGGGSLNLAGGNSSTVGGGNQNVSGGYATVVGGGEGNRIDSPYAKWTTIGGGRGNHTSLGTLAENSTIGGGVSNSVAGPCATVPGGTNCFAEEYAFAAGRNAKAFASGAFVWADSQNGIFQTFTIDQVAFRCGGGVLFTSGSGAANQTVAWTPGSGGWSFSSDRNLKDRFAEVDSQSVLAKLATLPIKEWSYKGYDQRHIGPMAQDFHALFPLNKDDKSLQDADLHGVAFAAIQGLNQKLEQKETEITELKARLEKLEQMIQQK